MSEQDNIDTTRRIIDALNHHDTTGYDKFFSDDFKGRVPGSPGELDRRGNVEFVRNYIQAFPDVHWDIKDILAQGEKVAVTWTVRGTHKGPMAMPTGDTIPATNRTAVNEGVNVSEFRNGKVVRSDIYFDLVTLMSQLGLTNTQQASSSSSSSTRRT